MQATGRITRRYVIVALILSIGSPLGLYLLQSLLQPSNSISLYVYIYNTLATALAFSMFAWFTGRRVAKARRKSEYDALTGLYNRYYLKEYLPGILRLASETGQALSLVLVDLDHFKQVNDTHGHTIGDQVLKAVSKVFTENRPEENCILVRLGGEEFLAVCPGLNEKEATALAESWRQKIERLTARELGFSGPQTVSAGVLQVDSALEEDFQFYLSGVDGLLYQAKRQGRNRVVASLDQAF